MEWVLSKAEKLTTAGAGKSIIMYKFSGGMTDGRSAVIDEITSRMMGQNTSMGYI